MGIRTERDSCRVRRSQNLSKVVREEENVSFHCLLAKMFIERICFFLQHCLAVC